MTKRFVFDLDDERRALLEAYRARNGLRSLAGALHHLIDGSAAPVNVADELRAMAVRDNEPGPTAKSLRKAAETVARAKTPAKPPKGSSEAVSQTAGRSDPLASVPLGPQPFKSRLKGTK